MKVIQTKLDGVFILEPKAFGDNRGCFFESYSHRVWSEVLGRQIDMVQDNHSLSFQAGTLRGLHYQLNPMAQAKIVRVVTGAIFDVAVDIREGSPTFGHWHSTTLTADNRRQIVVPQGFAHGVCTLVPNTQIQYKVDNYYSPENDRGIRWDDPEIGIEWPVTSPILSEKDQKQPYLADAEINFVFQQR